MSGNALVSYLEREHVSVVDEVSAGGLGGEPLDACEDDGRVHRVVLEHMHHTAVQELVAQDGLDQMQRLGRVTVHAVERVIDRTRQQSTAHELARLGACAAIWAAAQHAIDRERILLAHALPARAVLGRVERVVLIQGALDEVVAETLDVGATLGAEPDGGQPRGDRSVRHEGRKWGDVALHAGVGSGVTGHRSAPQRLPWPAEWDAILLLLPLHDLRELLVPFMHQASRHWDLISAESLTTPSNLF